MSESQAFALSLHPVVSHVFLEKSNSVLSPALFNGNVSRYVCEINRFLANSICCSNRCRQLTTSWFNRKPVNSNFVLAIDYFLHEADRRKDLFRRRRRISKDKWRQLCDRFPDGFPKRRRYSDERPQRSIKMYFVPRVQRKCKCVLIRNLLFHQGASRKST